MDIKFFGCATDVGSLREINEDSFCALPETGLWAVADGMGGYKGGKTASRITIEKLADDVRRGVSLAESISEIHHVILQAAKSDPELEGMGSTVVAMKTRGCNYEIAWVGDSRAYQWDGSVLKQLTRDHSYVQHLIDEGVITEKDAAEHPDRHAITQALGVTNLEYLEVGVVYGIFYQDTKILLCSDGLTNEVDDTQIVSILASRDSPQKAVNGLINAAIENGGSDNISVILVSAPDDAKPKGSVEDTEPLNIKQPYQKKERLLYYNSQVAIVLIGFLILIVLTVYITLQ